MNVLLLNETHLSKHRKFKLPNCHSYYTNKPLVNGRPPVGDTTILVHNRLIHHHVPINTNLITNTAIHIQIDNTELRLSAVYKSPRTIIQTADIEALLDTSANAITIGDLNSKHRSWYSWRNNAVGIFITNYLNTRIDTAVTSPFSPTHYPG